MTSSLPTIQRSRSLHEQVYEALRLSILSGELTPGDRLIETQLAERFQVSRTPLREAMRQLQRDTLVTADTGGGLRVTTFSVIDADQLYDCRLALEPLAAQGACAQVTSAQLEELNALVTKAETAVDRSFIDMLDLDYRFHRLIAESSGNRWLVTLLDQVFDKMTLLRVQTTKHNPKVLEIRSEHRRIYEAIAQRDTEAAIQTIQTHLIASKNRVIQELQNLHIM